MNITAVSFVITLKSAAQKTIPNVEIPRKLQKSLSHTQRAYLEMAKKWHLSQRMAVRIKSHRLTSTSKLLNTH